jgi:hypothetical protein
LTSLAGLTWLAGALVRSVRRSVFRGGQFAPEARRTIASAASAIEASTTAATSTAPTATSAVEAIPATTAAIAVTERRTALTVRLSRRRSALRGTSAARDGFAFHRLNHMARGSGFLRGRVLGMRFGVTGFVRMLALIVRKFGVRALTVRHGAGFHIGRLQSGRGVILGEHVAALLFHLLNLVDNGGNDVVELFAFFQKIADIQEGVAIEADFHEGRLHAWQHTGYTALVNATD